MVAAKPKPRCLDCVKEGVLTNRRATGKPLLCVTHRRARRFNRRTYNHSTHIQNTYGITSAEYQAIMDYQGGKCAICRRATGAKRKLSVDHDHADGKVRGCLCATDNKLLGHARDQIEFFERAIEYLKNPPAVAVIGVRITPDMVGVVQELDNER